MVVRSLTQVAAACQSHSLPSAAVAAGAPAPAAAPAAVAAAGASAPAAAAAADAPAAAAGGAACCCRWCLATVWPDSLATKMEETSLNELGWQLWITKPEQPIRM